MNQYEADKLYSQIYYDYPKYRMGLTRLAGILYAIINVPDEERSEFYDIGCGRFETRDVVGPAFKVCRGYDLPNVVRRLGYPDDMHQIMGLTHLHMSDNEASVVGCFDVLEHLPPEDIDAALAQLTRVARNRLILSIALYSHIFEGTELHLTIENEKWWTEKLAQFPHHKLSAHVAQKTLWIVLETPKSPEARSAHDSACHCTNLRD